MFVAGRNMFRSMLARWTTLGCLGGLVAQTALSPADAAFPWNRPAQVETIETAFSSFEPLEIQADERVLNGGCASCGESALGSCQCCNRCEESWWDNIQAFLGLDGSKQPQDLGVNANLGARASLGTSGMLNSDWNLGAQIGIGFNYSDMAVGVFDPLASVGERFQTYTTLGVFQRLDSGLSWGLAYDYLAQQYYDNYDLTQFRGRIAYDLGQRDQIGAWFTIADRSDFGAFTNVPVRLRAMNQGSFFWRHWWDNQARTTVWAGLSQSHNQDVLVLPPLPPTGQRLVFGADLHIPLNNYVALYGETNLVTPADGGTVDAYLGLAFYPGGISYQFDRRRTTAFQPIASPTSFSVDWRR